MEECVGAQEHNQPFHYSWLLVLIAFVSWKEPKHNEFLPVWNDCRGVCYAMLFLLPSVLATERNNLLRLLALVNKVLHLEQRSFISQ
jgi:hypothetical protein